MPSTVAIIEDNPEFLRRYRDIIEADPSLTLIGTAADGAAGLALIAQGRADVYLIDLGLPDLDGVELIRHAVKTHPGCDVVVISVFGDDAHVVASIEAGATGYLLKDSDPAAIADCIAVLRDGGAPVSPIIARKILQRFHLDKVAPATPQPTAANAAAPAHNLTEREVEILRTLAKGLSINEIGGLYAISPHTVARHVKNIYKKLAVHSRGEAVYEATILGLL